MALAGNSGSRVRSPVSAATNRKQSTPIGTVRAMPCVGVPVTTARRAAALLSAKLAADRTAKIAPSTVSPKARRRRFCGRLPAFRYPPGTARAKPLLAGLRQGVGNRFERGADLGQARGGGL